MQGTAKFTVSGTHVDRSYPDGGVALSAAITFASRHAGEVPTTFYVRTPEGEPFGRVESDGKHVLVYRTGRDRP